MPLYSPNGSVLRAVRTRPEPNLDTEEKVRKQLKSIDSLLDVRWWPHAVYNEAHNDFEGRYALVCEWPPGDARWELYQKGEIEDNVDFLGWFCEDIHDAHSVPVAVDSIERKILELLGKCDATRIPHSTRMAQIVEKNAKLRESRKQVYLDQAEDVASTLYSLAGKYDDTKVERIMKEITESAKHER